MVSTLWGLILAYLMGSIPTGFVVAKVVKGIDIREQGSGNVGASNVYRVVGARWGLLVLAVDILKGWVAVVVLYHLLLETGSTSLALVRKLVLGFAAIAGHNWTVFLRFKGGKGVATTCGVFLSIVPSAVACAMVVWVGVVSVSKYISVGSMGAALSCPLWIWIFYRGSENFYILLSASFLIPILIMYTHRSNIRKLMKGTESKIPSFKKKG